MDSRNLHASKEALVAIRIMVDDAMISPHVRMSPVKLTRYDLCYNIKRLQHLEICHYIRCDASREALILIGEAVNRLVGLLDDEDETAEGAIRVSEPFRHHLYTSVIIIALTLAEQDEIQREQEYWQRQNALRIGPPFVEASRA